MLIILFYLWHNTFMLRITGGIYCGRRVKVPTGEIRPAMDRMRISQFSILRSFDQKSFLDLFAGSGIMALEAASRGATRVVLVEKDRKKELVIRQNMAIAQDIDVKIVMTSVEAFLKTVQGSFDFIHLDPPFPYSDKLQLLRLVEQSSAWHHDTIITIHYPKRDKLPMQFGNWYCYDTRSYGESQLNFYQFLPYTEEI